MALRLPFGMGLLRTILAISVVLNHSQGIPGFRCISGWLPVECFFIISGFYMFMILDKGYTDTKRFYLNRFLRLFPVYFTVALLTAVIYAKYNIGNIASYPQNWPNFSLLTKLFLLVANFSGFFIDFALFLGIDAHSGALSLSQGAGNLNASNFLLIPQGWSLGLEYAFYLLVPFFARKSIRILLCIASLSILIRLLLPAYGLDSDVLLHRFFPTELIFFIAGGILYRAYTSWIASFCLKHDALPGICTAVLLASTLWAGLMPLGNDAIYATYIAIFITMLPFAFHNSKDSKADRAIGELSYPVYICHLLVIEIISHASFAPHLKELQLYGVLAVASSMLVALLLNFSIQEPAEKLRMVVRQGSIRLPALKDLAGGLSNSLKSLVRTRAMSRALAILPTAIILLFIASNITAIKSRIYPRTYIDIFKDSANPASGHKTFGFGPVESDPNNARFIWGIGPTSVLCLDLPQKLKLRLHTTYQNTIPGLTLNFTVNGIPVESSETTGQTCATCDAERSVDFECEEGLNIIGIRYSDWNGNSTKFAPNDPRFLSVAYRSFFIETIPN